MQKRYVHKRKVLHGFKKISYVLEGSGQNSRAVPDFFTKEMESEGHFNGDILIPFMHEVNGDELVVRVMPGKFFEAVYNLKNILATNAIVILSDGGVVLIKRGEDVFSFPGYWDFPAGFIPYKKDLSVKQMIMDRMENRVRTDLKIDVGLEISDQLPLVVQDEVGAFCLFHVVNLDMTTKEAKEFFAKNFDERKKPMVVGSDEIESFVINEKKILFPEALKMKFDIN